MSTPSQDSEGSDNRELIAFRKYRDEDWLREQYHEQGNTEQEIAELCGCSRKTIVKWLDRHDIEFNSTNQATDRRLNYPEWLREQYHEKGLSTLDIADKCDCSSETVRYWLDKHDIDTRSPGGAHS
jgi:Transposase.